MSNETREDRRFLVNALLEIMAGKVREKVPESGRFAAVCLRLVYPGTEHEGRMYTQYSDEHGCVFRISMVVEGTDMEISNYLFFGPKEECIAWLQDKSHVEEVVGYFNNLVKLADEKS